MSKITSKSDNDAENVFSQDVWDRFVATDKFIDDCVLHHDPVQEDLLAKNKAAGLPDIDVAPNEGKLFYLFAKSISAKNILEVGTLGAYSTIWFARAVPAGGKVITLEINPQHAKTAEANIKTAGFADTVDVRLGPALETLEKLEAEGWGQGADKRSFDFVFIDADKENNWEYVEWALKFAHVGTVIVVDNVGRRGKLADASFTEGRIAQTVVHTRRMFEEMGKDKRLEVTGVQTVGCRGWDGFAYALVVAL